MALEQETFLGASIRGFNASMGWGNQSSTLSVDLVEDSTNGDSFDPPSVGTAVIFNYSGWQFGGLLQNYQRQYGTQGNPVYSVSVQDPRELLAGVQLILQDYSGSTYGVPNIYNIYGYLESLYGFGGSQANDTGIPWMLVRDAFYTLQLSTPIYFRGSYFVFDPFVNIDLLPSYYRIGGDSISALDYIQNICDAISCDFSVEMIALDNDETPATNSIQVKLISRNYTLQNNIINQFVESTQGAVSKVSGYELSNEVTSRFVVGGKLNNVYFRTQATGNSATYRDDMIVPYWGYNAYDRLVIGQGNFNGETGKEYTFTLDGRPLYLQTGKQSLVHYKTDLAEMRAARAGQSSWESFLWVHNINPNSIHFGKADAIGLTDGQLSDQVMAYLKNWKKEGGPPPKFTAAEHTKTDFKAMKTRNILSEERQKQVSKVYSYIKKYATEYYGKKFMVRVPFVTGTYISGTTDVKYSLKPVQAGYVSEAYWNNATALGYMPYNPEKFTDAQNKVYPYGRFAGMSEVENSLLKSRYAFDKLPLDSYILDQYPNLKKGVMRENLFVKAKVDENLVFLNPNTLFSPRAVVTLDGAITDNVDSTELHTTGLMSELKAYLSESPTALSDEKIEAWGNDFVSLIGNDFTWKAKEGRFFMPSMIAIPLESQILRYGPWYISNSAGKVEFENDSTLVPWNYGGFTAMNQAGWAKVEDALTSQQQHETGSVEFPGVPSLSLGSALLSGGPIVTDVNIDISERGVTTTYRMATWTHQFGRLGKYNVERFAQMSQLAQKQRKAFRQFYGYQAPVSILAAEATEETKKETSPSVLVMGGSMVKDESGDSTTVKPSVAAMPGERISKIMTDDDVYAKSACVSLDGLFVPYTTKYTDGGTDLPHFEEPEDGASEPTSTHLNPLGHSSIGKVMPDTDSRPDDLDDTNTDAKSIALRSPIVVAGWGYDTDGEIVPTGDNYKTRADQWKVGPLDVRWNDDRKVWAAGSTSSGSDLKKGKLNTALHAGESVEVTIWEYDSDSGDIIATSTTKTCRDWLLPDGTYLPYNSKVYIGKIDNLWYVMGATPPC